MTKHHSLSSCCAALAVLTLASAGDVHAKGPKPTYALLPAGTAKFAPLDPRAPQGPQLAVVSGDLKAGPVAILLKLPKGSGGVHWHTSDYAAVLIEGSAKHWLAGRDADAVANSPGTAWFQPGGSAATAHGDECLSETCTVFVYLPNGLDFTPVAKH